MSLHESSPDGVTNRTSEENRAENNRRWHGTRFGFCPETAKTTREPESCVGTLHTDLYYFRGVVLTLEMSHVAWSVCLSVGYTDMLCKNGWTVRDAVWGLTHVGQGTLDGVEIFPGEGAILGVVRPIVNHWGSLLRCTQQKWRRHLRHLLQFPQFIVTDHFSGLCRVIHEVRVCVFVGMSLPCKWT